MTDRTAPHTHWPDQFSPNFDETRPIYKLIDVTNRYMLGYMQSEATLAVNETFDYTHGFVGAQLHLRVLNLEGRHTSDVDDPNGADMILAYVRPE